MTCCKHNLKMNVLEAFSGIGGMHLALTATDSNYDIKCAIDINTTANEVYKHNFPQTNLLNRNIQSLTPEFIRKLNINTILMSPPCQPFTRNGLKRDVRDRRTDAFKHILTLINSTNIERILLENVKGFEDSEMHDLFVKTLQKNGYFHKEYMLSPHEFNVPNTRYRYYCLARKSADFEEIPKPSSGQPFEISDVTEKNIPSKYYLNEETLKKYGTALDICYPNSRRSCCFTRAYGRYIVGTGSVFTDVDKEKVDEIYQNSGDLKTLNLRYFTPKEVCRLMNFPDNFKFPNISDKQKYQLLGNSVNVKVVSELLKMLMSR